MMRDEKITLLLIFWYYFWSLKMIRHESDDENGHVVLKSENLMIWKDDPDIKHTQIHT